MVLGKESILHKPYPDTVSMERLNYFSGRIIQAAINVHKILGPGLLESVYQRCMAIELTDMQMKVEAEIPLPIFYRGQRVHEEGFRIDLLVECTVIVELKSVEMVKKVHKKQLLTYLRLAEKPLGYPIHPPLMDSVREGMKRNENGKNW